MLLRRSIGSDVADLVKDPLAYGLKERPSLKEALKGKVRELKGAADGEFSMVDPDQVETGLCTRVRGCGQGADAQLTDM